MRFGSMKIMLPEFVISFVKGILGMFVKNEMYEKVCIIVCVFDVACVCPNEFSRIEFRESIGESEGEGKGKMVFIDSLPHGVDHVKLWLKKFCLERSGGFSERAIRVCEV